MGSPLLHDYARFIFNTNVLPKDLEHNTGFFRRFIIIEFDQTISDEEKEQLLSTMNELKGGK